MGAALHAVCPLATSGCWTKRGTLGRRAAPVIPATTNRVFTRVSGIQRSSGFALVRGDHCAARDFAFSGPNEAELFVQLTGRQILRSS